MEKKLIMYIFKINLLFILMDINNLVNNNNNIFNEIDENIIDIRCLKRNNRKHITIIQNLELNENESSKDLLSFLKKKLSCNGSYDNETNEYKLQGDHREELKSILEKKLDIKKKNLRIH